MTCVVLAEVTVRGVSEPLEAAGRALHDEVKRLGEMEHWIKDQGLGGAVYLDHDIAGGRHIVTLGFEFADPDEAFWFKLRWIG